MLTHPPSPSSLQLKIAALDTDSLARAAGFLRRRSHKLTPANFLLTTCLFALQHRCSLASFAQHWAALATMQEGSQVSLLKLAQWWATFAFVFCVQARNVPPDGLILQPLYYCSYEKRKKRLNFLQKCAFLG